MSQIQKMKMDEKTTLFVDFEHINKFTCEQATEQGDLGEDLLTNYYRFEPWLRRGLTKVMFDEDPDYAKDKLFFVAFYNLPTTFKLRDMKTAAIGRLASIYGTVTRSTEVRPELLTGTFRCKECNVIIEHVE